MIASSAMMVIPNGRVRGKVGAVADGGAMGATGVSGAGTGSWGSALTDALFSSSG